MHWIRAEPKAQAWVVVASTVIVQVRLLIQLLLSPLRSESVPKGRAAVELVGADTGGVLLLDERLTPGQVLNALCDLAILIGDDRTAAEVVLMIELHALTYF